MSRKSHVPCASHRMGIAALNGLFCFMCGRILYCSIYCKREGLHSHFCICIYIRDPSDFHKSGKWRCELLKTISNIAFISVEFISIHFFICTDFCWIIKFVHCRISVCFDQRKFASIPAMFAVRAHCLNRNSLS